jgi:hypothetical protein
MLEHIVVYISGHGYGHAAQTSAVLNCLLHTHPSIKITICSKLNAAFLRARFQFPIDIIDTSSDFGMEMASAVDTLVDASHLRYTQFHRDWTQHVELESKRLRALQPSLVVSNVGYLPLQAAATAGLPAVAMCSLNWRDIYAHYCNSLPGADRVLADMEAAYCSSQCFIQFTPHMPMAWLDARRSVGPVAHSGKNQRARIAAQHKLGVEAKFWLVSLGGIETNFSIDNWPQHENVHYIVPAAWRSQRKDCIAIETLGLPFTDILCSSEALITKPGYGSFVEAGCHGIPVIYVDRPDWPESPFLNDWIHVQGRAARVTRAQLQRGELREEVLRLIAAAAPSPSPPTGNQEAAAILWELCRS